MAIDDLNQIRAIRTQTLATLRELAFTPKPTYKVDNYEISWNDYQKRLAETVDWCDRKIAETESCEFRSEATT